MKNHNTLHASLFSPGFWEVHGCYCDDKGTPVWTEGQTRISFRAGSWCSENYLQMSDNRTIRTCYQIEASGTDTANWTSRSSLLDKCSGMYLVQGDLILSTYSSDDGKYTGHEILRRHSDNHYTIFGELYCRSQRDSTWSLELRKSSVIDSDEYWLPIYPGHRYSIGNPAQQCY
jgi:hypothetical protein